MPTATSPTTPVIRPSAVPDRTPVPPRRAGPDRPLVVLYDGDCAFCSASVRSLRRWDRDRHIDLISLQAAPASPDPIVRTVAETYPLRSALHVIDRRTGDVSAGGRAVLAIVDVLPGGPLLRPWATLPPTAAVADLVYSVVSDRRQDLGWAVGIRHEVHCPIPDVAEPPA
jgi:predicted DCC family thiol-disulfide oxidoreductase YuxK